MGANIHASAHFVVRNICSASVVKEIGMYRDIILDSFSGHLGWGDIMTCWTTVFYFLYFYFCFLCLFSQPVDVVPDSVVVGFSSVGKTWHFFSKYCFLLKYFLKCTFLLYQLILSFYIFQFSLFLSPSLKYINVPRSPLSQIILSLAKTLLFLTVTYHSSISWQSILSSFCLFLPFTCSSLSVIFWLLLLQN